MKVSFCLFGSIFLFFFILLSLRIEIPPLVICTVLFVLFMLLELRYRFCVTIPIWSLVCSSPVKGEFSCF